MPNLNHHQFRQALGSLIGHNIKSPVWLSHYDDDPYRADFLAALEHGLNCPASPDTVFVLPDRFPILTDMNRKKRSMLVQLLLDRCDDTALVADSCLTGKDALHYARLVTNWSDVSSWLQQMNPVSMSLTLRPIDEQYSLMLSNLSSFVFNGDS